MLSQQVGLHHPPRSTKKARRTTSKTFQSRESGADLSSRAISKTEVNSLKARIEELETLLRRQAGTSSPKDAPSPQDQNGAQTSVLEPDLQIQPPDSLTDYSSMLGQITEPIQFLGSPENSNSSPYRLDGSGSCVAHSPASSLADAMPEGRNKLLVQRLISASSQPVFDHSSGRLRPVGPVTAFHHFSDTNAESEASGPSREQRKRVERLLRDLPPDTHDHLMESFWTHFNPILYVVDRAAFTDDKDSEKPQFYSGFLHVCILAMGFEYADRKRTGIQSLVSWDKESTLHKEAKYMVEFEIEKSGVPTVQGLLIFSELEASRGRDTMGWIYAGTSYSISCL